MISQPMRLVFTFGTNDFLPIRTHFAIRRDCFARRGQVIRVFAGAGLFRMGRTMSALIFMRNRSSAAPDYRGHLLR